MAQLALISHIHQELRRRLKEQDPELDEETLADTVEGMTDLHQMLCAIVRGALDDEAISIGLKGRVRDMQARLARAEERAEIRRRIVRQVMLEAEIKKLTDPEFTASIRPGTPSLLVVEEASIPPEFWEAKAPRLKRLELLQELKGGRAVAGVALSNAEPVLSVRSR
jgi:hypothetical protein